MIAVKLKRQVEQLKDNRRGKVFDEKAFDQLVEESVRLQAEEKSLTEKIKAVKHAIPPPEANKHEQETVSVLRALYSQVEKSN